MQDKVYSLITEHLDVPLEKITPQAKFVEDLGADSLDIVEMMMSLEEAFGIDIPDEEAEKLKTVQDVLGYLEQNAKK